MMTALLRVIARAAPDGRVLSCIPLARADSSGAVYVAWDEAKHPRHPKGSGDQGGEFAPKSAEAKTDENGFGVFEPDNTYAGVADGEWDDWTQYSYEVNAALEGTLKAGQTSSLGETITESDVAEFKRIGQKIQRAAESNYLVGNFALFRGEAYDTIDAARNVYKHNALIKFDRLTSTATSLSAATEYASGQGGNEGRAKVILAFQQRGGIQGIQTAPLGVPSNEVVLPKGAQFRVVGVRPAGKNSIVVELYSKVEPKGQRVVDQFGKRESYGGLQGLIAHASKQSDFAQSWDEAEHPRHPRGTEDGGEFAPSEGGVGEAFEDAPLDGKKAAAWRKKMQQRYDTDPEFRAAANAAMLFTQGDYEAVRAMAIQEITGELPERFKDSALPMWRDKPMFRNPLAKYKEMFKGQPFVDGADASAKETWGQSVRALNNAVATGPRLGAPIYRGVYGRENIDQLLSIAPGKTFDVVGPTSFTADKTTAELFSTNTARGQRGKGLAHGVKSAVIEVAAGARGVPVQALSPWKQQEVISGGRFRVKEVVKTPDGLHRVRVEQVETFKNAKGSK